MDFAISSERREKLRKMLETPEPALQLVADEQLEWNGLCRAAVDALPALLHDLDAAEVEIKMLRLKRIERWTQQIDVSGS